MDGIAVFAGTSEGRELAFYLDRKGISAWILVATQYGAGLLAGLAPERVAAGRMDQAQMEAFLKEKGIGLAVDATHPYARLVSGSLKEACAACGTAYMRLCRERTEPGEYLPADRIVRVGTLQEAVEFLNTREGNVFASTGGKEAALYFGLREYERRLYIRLLPDVQKQKELLQAGLPASHILTGQGPFSEEENKRQFLAGRIRWLVTKESGPRGGLPEKLRAAAACGVCAVILDRPREDGLSMRQIKRGIDCFLEGQERKGEEGKHG